MPDRDDRIRRSLDWCVAKGIIRAYGSQSMMPGTRWNLDGFGFTSRSYTTSEVEIFILAASEGRTSGLLDAKAIVEGKM